MNILQTILNQTSKIFEVCPKDLRSERRYQSVAMARNAFYYIASRAGHKHREIAVFMGKQRRTVTRQIPICVSDTRFDKHYRAKIETLEKIL